MSSITERYADRILGTLSCFDRVVITGTLVDIGYAAALAARLTARGFRLFDYTKFAEPLRDEVRAAAESLAAQSGLEIEYIQRKSFRKEDRVREVLRQRGDAPGLVHTFSAMEASPSFRPWHDKTTHQTSLKSREAKCLHYYFYFIDADLGLCYLHGLLKKIGRTCKYYLTHLGQTVIAAGLRLRQMVRLPTLAGAACS
jgi:hypothetical protein